MAHKKKETTARKERAVRRRNLARGIDLTWSSLRTHLADAVVSKRHSGKPYCNEEWEARCVREYAEVIYTQAVELHELTKKDFPEVNEPLMRAVK